MVSHRAFWMSHVADRTQKSRLQSSLHLLMGVSPQTPGLAALEREIYSSKCSWNSSSLELRVNPIRRTI